MRIKQLLGFAILYSLPQLASYYIKSLTSIDSLVVWIVTSILFILVLYRHVHTVKAFPSGCIKTVSPILILIVSIFFFFILNIILLGIYGTMTRGGLEGGFNQFAGKAPALLVETLLTIVLSIIPLIVSIILISNTSKNSSIDSV